MGSEQEGQASGENANSEDEVTPGFGGDYEVDKTRTTGIRYSRHNGKTPSKTSGAFQLLWGFRQYGYAEFLL